MTPAWRRKYIGRAEPFLSRSPFFRYDSDMGGFTRLLHAFQPDGLEKEIPTVRVDPLPPGEVRGAAEYVKIA